MFNIMMLGSEGVSRAQSTGQSAEVSSELSKVQESTAAVDTTISGLNSFQKCLEFDIEGSGKCKLVKILSDSKIKMQTIDGRKVIEVSPEQILSVEVKRMVEVSSQAIDEEVSVEQKSSAGGLSSVTSLESAESRVVKRTTLPRWPDDYPRGGFSSGLSRRPKWSSVYNLQKNPEGKFILDTDTIFCGDSVADACNRSNRLPQVEISLGGRNTTTILENLRHYTFKSGARVPIICGYNDIPNFTNSVSNIMKMAEYIKSQGAVPIVCINHTVIENKNFIGDKFEAFDSYRTNLKRAADDDGYKIADLRSIQAPLHPGGKIFNSIINNA